jgi:hypothetical protein
MIFKALPKKKKKTKEFILFSGEKCGVPPHLYK